MDMKWANFCLSARFYETVALYLDAEIQKKPLAVAAYHGDPIAYRQWKRAREFPFLSSPV
jgi:hypothetical protein